MEDRTIVLYSSPEHLNSMLILAKFIAKHHQPSVHVTILCSAPAAAADSVVNLSSITYHHIPAVPPPTASITDLVEFYFEISRLNNPKVRDALQEISQKSKILAFVIDFFSNSAFELSTSLNIPTYFYVSSGAFGVCALLYFPTIDETIPGNIADLDDFLEVPGCPPIHCSDFPKAMVFRQSNTYKHFLSTAMNMRRAKGIVVNSFDALEYRAKEALSNGLCAPKGASPPAYFVGPLIGEAPGKNTGADHDCLKWLDSQPSRSVIFLCFGRRGLFSAKQLREMAIGLENSGYRFLWSVRSPPENRGSPASEEAELDEILPNGFLERTKERGFVIKSWAPQKELLSHDSVAAFVTHCGRSSILEAVSFGVPMIGWPMYAEQRMNRVFLVEEMKLALSLEAAVADGFVTAGELEKRIRELMETPKGRAIRQRVAEMQTAADRAIQQNGSSLAALEKFVHAVNED